MFATELTIVIATLAGLLVIGLRLVATLGLLALCSLLILSRLLALILLLRLGQCLLFVAVDVLVEEHVQSIVVRTA